MCHRCKCEVILLEVFVLIYNCICECVSESSSVKLVSVQTIENNISQKEWRITQKAAIVNGKKNVLLHRNATTDNILLDN